VSAALIGALILVAMALVVGTGVWVLSHWMNYREVTERCKEFRLSEDMTHQLLWDEGYRLGRSRWHWGPCWWVNCRVRFSYMIKNRKRRVAETKSAQNVKT
jgi:hypothetical protein